MSKVVFWHQVGRQTILLFIQLVGAPGVDLALEAQIQLSPLLEEI